jgi:protein phosphatase
MSNFIECPHCKFQNPEGSRYCKECGQSLAGEKSQASGRERGLVGWIAKKVNRVLDVTDEFLDAFSPRSSSPKGSQPAQVIRSEPGAVQNQAASNQALTVRMPQKVLPKQPGTTISYFQILETIPLARSNYYKVYNIRCENCQTENANSNNLTCSHCHQPLRRFVLRESFAAVELEESYRKKLIYLSEHVAGTLKHNLIFYLGSTQYILLDGYPEPWFSLGLESRLPVGDGDKVISWLSQLGSALKGLHQAGYFLNDENKLVDWVEPILVLKNQQAYLADITSASPLDVNMAGAVQKDILYLAKVLFTIVTGSRQNLSRAADRVHNIPSSFQEVIMKALRGGFSTVDSFLTALQHSPREPEVVRSLRQLVGYGTDVGKSRDHNEDYVSKFSLGLEQIPGTPEVGLYIVADGMGGHQAGEKASESVIKDVVINRIQEQLQQLQAVPKLKRATIKLDDVLTPGEILREAILQANQVLLNARKALSGRDRGTTITAALVVGSTCTVANVGDSRTYLLRSDKLTQITQDHSLVASLVASNMIKPSEVRSHPQRNQIYRTLGDKPQIEVDIFQKTLVPGDQLLLCSDGLWEMVLDDAIEKIMRTARTPQSACDRLIEAANAGGGEDNISVVVVWLE